MIICRTPYRISFFGGGTDYPTWYRQHGGAVLATTIDKYCYLSVRHLPPFFEHRYRVVWSKIENAQRVEDITHPAIRETLKYLRYDRGLEIHHDGDLPARSGMGSSSSFLVGFLHAMHALRGRMVAKRDLALESIHVEQNVMGESVGSQDQVLAAHGGLNHVQFLQSGDIVVRPVTILPERQRALCDHIMLFFSGVRRTASEVASSFVPTLQEKERQLNGMRELVERGIQVLGGDGDLAEFGELLHEGWQLKRGLSGAISNQTIDGLYEAARAAGATGGKLLGAGGGGFLCLFVPPERQEEVRQALAHLIHVPFQFESQGTQIVFWDPDEDYTLAERQRGGQAISPFAEWNSV
jgi:D-glycero-alpha-D-manno-heptose-7-phosphate kinase